MGVGAVFKGHVLAACSPPAKAEFNVVNNNILIISCGLLFLLSVRSFTPRFRIYLVLTLQPGSDMHAVYSFCIHFHLFSSKE